VSEDFFGNIEERIEAALESDRRRTLRAADKHDRINALFGGDNPFGRDSFGNRYKPMSVTGRFRVPSPNLNRPVPRYTIMTPPSCPCMICAKGEQVETPLHPRALDYMVTKALDREREFDLIQQQRRARLLNEEIQLSKDRGRIIW
jgi:hypothetical protein